MSDDTWLEGKNEEALRSREEEDFHRGDPRYDDEHRDDEPDQDPEPDDEEEEA